jgi:hypothetical protein
MERFEPPCLLSFLNWLYSWLHNIYHLSCGTLTGKLTGNAHLFPKRFIDLAHRLLLHRR